MFGNISMDNDADKEKDKKDSSPGLQNEIFESRTIIISEEVSPELAKKVFSQLVILNQRSTKDPIKVYINSPGGCADSGFAIYDMFKFFEAPVITIISGMCASAAVMIFLGADKGKNYSLPNSRFLLHQPSTGIRGSASDIQITADEIEKTRVRYNEVVAGVTGKTADQVSNDADRDFWMSPQEAAKYGLVKKVITGIKEAK
ncbi:MAG: ATP-dependent Clp protease proteolytic subunit [Lentisphaeraceae bacterium]|nr:ATP-dependent Clp protease proteolytic subunit [Lentisphaeraceae bacterium]